MKKTLLLILPLLFIMSCDTDDDETSKCQVIVKNKAITVSPVLQFGQNVHEKCTTQTQESPY